MPPPPPPQDTSPIILLRQSYDTRHFVCHCFIDMKHQRRSVSYALWPMRREIFYRHVKLRESFFSDTRRRQRQMGARTLEQLDPDCRRSLLGLGIGWRVKETAISTCSSFLRSSRRQIMDGETAPSHRTSWFWSVGNVLTAYNTNNGKERSRNRSS